MPNLINNSCYLRPRLNLAFFLLLIGFGTSQAYAQQRETLRVESLISPVEIVTDRWGISHIYAENEHDLFSHRDTTRPETDCFSLRSGAVKRLGPSLKSWVNANSRVIPEPDFTSSEVT